MATKLGRLKKRNPVSTPTSSTVMNLHQNSNIKYISGPYINGISEKNSSMEFHLKSKLSNLIDKVSQINQNNVMYRLDCNDCDKI